MDLHVDPTSDVPIYLQIVERIKYLIATGDLKPGEQLPTVRQVAVELSVNPNTVARAYTELDREGIISTQQGRGTYVRQRPDAEHLARARREKLHSLLNHLLVQAFSLGYRPDEVRTAFEEELRSWLQQNPAPAHPLSAKQEEG
jgi:GntR family transcriptional regulator